MFIDEVKITDIEKFSNIYSRMTDRDMQEAEKADKEHSEYVKENRQKIYAREKSREKYIHEKTVEIGIGPGGPMKVKLEKWFMADEIKKYENSPFTGGYGEHQWLMEQFSEGKIVPLRTSSNSYFWVENGFPPLDDNSASKVHQIPGQKEQFDPPLALYCAYGQDGKRVYFDSRNGNLSASSPELLLAAGDYHFDPTTGHWEPRRAFTNPLYFDGIANPELQSKAEKFSKNIARKLDVEPYITANDGSRITPLRNVGTIAANGVKNAVGMGFDFLIDESAPIIMQIIQIIVAAIMGPEYEKIGLSLADKNEARLKKFEEKHPGELALRENVPAYQRQLVRDFREIDEKVKTGELSPKEADQEKADMLVRNSDQFRIIASRPGFEMKTFVTPGVLQCLQESRSPWAPDILGIYGVQEGLISAENSYAVERRAAKAAEEDRQKQLEKDRIAYEQKFGTDLPLPAQSDSTIEKKGSGSGLSFG